MRIVYYLLVLLAVPLPAVSALLLPHSHVHELDWLERRDVCLTAYTDRALELSVVCEDGYTAQRPVPAGVPVTLCFTVVGDASKLCTFTLGEETAHVYIRVVPRSLISAVLAVLLVVLIVRFASKLTRIYTKST